MQSTNLLVPTRRHRDEVDVAPMLVRDLGMTAAMADGVVLNIPQIETARFDVA